MIKLNKTIKRECEFVSIRHKGKHLPVVVELAPGDMLTFRAKGCRNKTEISLNYCMVLADILNANHMYKKAISDYKEGRRKRRPKKAQYPYSKIFYDSLR